MLSPFVAPIALPLALTLVLYALGRRVPALRERAGWAGVCVAAGFAAGYVSLEGLPPWLPVASKQKFVAIALGALLWPLVAGRVAGPRGPVVAAGLWALAAAAWIGIRRLGDPAALAVCALLAGALVATLVCTSRLERRGAAVAVAPFIALGAGLSLVALHGASASLSLLSASVAAGAGAIALVAALSELLGGPRLPVGVPARSVFAAVSMAVAAVLIWFTPKAHLGALALIALAPVPALLALRFREGPPGTPPRWDAVLAPVLAVGLAALPVGLGALLASRAAGLD